MSARRFDLLNFHANHFDAPFVRRFIQHLPQLTIDAFTTGQRLIEFQVADDVAEIGLRELDRGHRKIGATL